MIKTLRIVGPALVLCAFGTSAGSKIAPQQKPESKQPIAIELEFADHKCRLHVTEVSSLGTVVRLHYDDIVTRLFDNSGHLIPMRDMSKIRGPEQFDWVPLDSSDVYTTNIYLEGRYIGSNLTDGAYTLIVVLTRAPKSEAAHQRKIYGPWRNIWQGKPLVSKPIRLRYSHGSFSEIIR